MINFGQERRRRIPGTVQSSVEVGTDELGDREHSRWLG